MKILQARQSEKDHNRRAILHPEKERACLVGHVCCLYHLFIYLVCWAKGSPTVAPPPTPLEYHQVGLPLANVLKVLYPSSCPQASAFDQPPSLRTPFMDGTLLNRLQTTLNFKLSFTTFARWFTLG